ncbi:MAG: hypothetical protein KAI17_18150 [Thiotrichaceae bacterium]|nr:hypothetical protein [Thiotrichaceae bacterium]
MVLINQVKRLLDTQEKRVSAIITLVISVIIVTPLCGFIFQCGCDWPWAGLDSLCNFYKLDAEHKCPWCASMTTGILSIGGAIIAGLWATTISLPVYTERKIIKVITLRIIFGTIVFVLLASFIAGLAAFYQGYPLGIGSKLDIN